MKRIRMLTLLGMLAVALPIGLLQGVARAEPRPRSVPAVDSPLDRILPAESVP